MIIGQWLAHDSPTPDQFSIAYGFSACILEQRVSADEKVGCAGCQALLVRSIAPFVLRVYYHGPPSVSALWTLERGDWFRAWEQEASSGQSSGGVDLPPRWGIWYNASTSVSACGTTAASSQLGSS